MLHNLPLAEVAPLVGLITLIELAAGAALLAWLIDVVGAVGTGYRGTTAAICLAIMLVALLLLWGIGSPASLTGGAITGSDAALSHWAIGFTVALAVDALFSLVGTPAARHVVGAVCAAVGVVAVAQAASLVSPGDLGRGLVAYIPATLLVGAALAGMLLGHWYLIAPDLTFKPLRRGVYLMFAAIALEALAVLVSLLTASPRDRTDVISVDGAPFWLMVVGSGVVFTAVVNGLTLYFARIRANQPATAMLYVLIITALLGVVPADLLFLQTGVAL